MFKPRFMGTSLIWAVKPSRLRRILCLVSGRTIRLFPTNCTRNAKKLQTKGSGGVCILQLTHTAAYQRGVSLVPRNQRLFNLSRIPGKSKERTGLAADLVMEKLPSRD